LESLPMNQLEHRSRRTTDLAVIANTLEGQHGSPSQPTFTVGDLLDVFRRRRGLMAAIFLGTFTLAMVAFFNATRLYKGSAEIQVQKGSADAVGLDGVRGGAGDAGEDAMESNITLQTEAQILQSESLALSVIKTLNLDKTPDFHPKPSAIGWVLGLFAPKGAQDPNNVPLDDAPGRRSSAVKMFESRLKVKPVSGTRLIDIEYYSSDPRTAAAVVNLLVKDLMDYNFETRHVATASAAGWLGNQLSDLRKQTEALQAHLVELQKGSGIFTLGQTDNQGREQTYTPLLDQLQQSTAQLTQAESARVLKGALYQVVKTGNPELISGLAGSATASGASSGLSDSLTLLQGLRAQEAQTQAELDQTTDKFGSAYPKIGELNAKLAGIQKSIQSEVQRIAGRVKNDYMVAQDVENKDRASFQQQKAQATDVNSKAIDYEITRQEVQQSQDLYGSLLRRLKEADLIAGLRSSNITVVDSASIPARPSKPNPILYIGGGLAAGMFFSCCIGLYRDATDNRIQSIGDIPSLPIAPPIAFLPFHRRTGPRWLSAERNDRSSVAFGTVTGGQNGHGPTGALVAVGEPRAAYTEALRGLRTALTHSPDGQPAPQVVLITSSLPGEGKSMLSLNLAAVFAQSGSRVLLVDGDLRTPVLHSRLECSGADGLSNFLSSDDHDVMEPTLFRVRLNKRAGVDFLPAGEPPDFPAELLASDAMVKLLNRWRKTYDFIFIDGAPMLPVTDSAILSRYADYTVVVARHNQTDRSSLERTCQFLRAYGGSRQGVVLNGVKQKGGAQYPYYGYKATGSEGRWL
jgi:succinoglycan biosynthesis transport protein ExoP